MSFIQKYKKDIIELLNKNMNSDRKYKSKINLKKIHFNNPQKNKVHTVHLKNINIFINSRLKMDPNQNLLHSKIKSCNSINSSSNNNKNKTKTKINKNLIPIYKINNRTLKKKDNYNIFPDIKHRLNKSCSKLKDFRNINEEINNNINKKIEHLLSINYSKYRMLNKIERLNFYNKIKKAHDNINNIKNKTTRFNHSMLLFAPSSGLYQK